MRLIRERNEIILKHIWFTVSNIVKIGIIKKEKDSSFL